MLQSSLRYQYEHLEKKCCLQEPTKFLWCEMSDIGDINVTTCIYELEADVVLELARLAGRPLGEVNVSLRVFESSWQTLIKHKFATLAGHHESPVFMCLSRINKLCAGAVGLCIKVAERESIAFGNIRADLVQHASSATNCQ